MTRANNLNESSLGDRLSAGLYSGKGGLVGVVGSGERTYMFGLYRKGSSFEVYGKLHSIQRRISSLYLEFLLSLNFFRYADFKNEDVVFMKDKRVSRTLREYVRNINPSL